MLYHSNLLSSCAEAAHCSYIEYACEHYTTHTPHSCTDIKEREIGCDWRRERWGCDTYVVQYVVVITSKELPFVGVKEYTNRDNPEVRVCTACAA